MELSKYIAALLHKHNCVIVPEFGGFVANYKSAVVDNYRKKAYPPSKSVLFNPNLINNDGLLGNYVAQKEDITYSDALDDISDAVKKWLKAFDNGERIEIGEIGFLYRERGNIHFEQSREVNLLLEAYGLRSVDFVAFDQAVEKREKVETIKEFKPTVKEEVITPKELKPVLIKEEPKNEVVVVEEKTVDQKETVVISLNEKEKIQEDNEANVQVSADVIPIKKGRAVTVFKYAVAVAFVPILFYSYWIPMETDAVETSSIQLSDFNPIHKQSKKVYVPRDSDFKADIFEHQPSLEELTENVDAKIYNLEVAEDFYLPVDLEKKEVVDNNEFYHADVAGKYQIIAGCFSVKANAETLVSQLQKDGFAAAILDKNKGLHRVTAGGFDSRDAAENGLDKVKNAGHSAWILKK
ncbi:SPOR domain-containing protein [Paracrocinitomix mangrovi]|uniref:HU domain-containing protein n=1 Tax=Paracrocinitomix mangrovi TaxID=2862509 RepID=UPI001C8D1EA6|nr:SPOR domain-containing protein [Paracrocinitomix mangrovi]UKN00148.1 SPOR domain-containing protein [Paracrocinitomix mangrovi]